MPNRYSLGQHLEAFIQGQLSSGRCSDASEVLRDSLRLMEDRERRLAPLDASISRGLSDITAGRVHDSDAVFDNLETKYTKMKQGSGEL